MPPSEKSCNSFIGFPLYLIFHHFTDPSKVYGRTRKNYVVEHWNSLLRKVMESPALELLKGNIKMAQKDMVWREDLLDQANGWTFNGLRKSFPNSVIP